MNIELSILNLKNSIMISKNILFNGHFRTVFSSLSTKSLKNRRYNLLFNWMEVLSCT